MEYNVNIIQIIKINNKNKLLELKYANNMLKKNVKKFILKSNKMIA